MQIALPEGLIARFRTVSLERVGRIEGTWNALIQGVHDDDAIAEMARDVHTLKGDAKMVGFDEVAALAHKLEELLAVASERAYSVSEDLELVVTMATQFVGMLLRKKSGGTAGIDLAGFIRQVDEVVREAQTVPMPPRMVAHRARSRSDAPLDRLSETTRSRLAIAATETFLEYVGARGGTSRTRLRGVWRTLREELAHIHAVPLARLLERHVGAATRLASELGKELTVEADAGTAYVEPRVAEAIDVALVHLVRNAVDHGIETPVARKAAGKPVRGTLRVSARERSGLIEIVVEDDGAGIDVARVGARAVELGLASPSAVATASGRELLELLFHPGFTTRTQVTSVSGRGVGMDAVKASIVRAGGKVVISTVLGKSSTFTLLVPAALRSIAAHQFLGPGGRMVLAVPAQWTPTMEPALSPRAIDPIAAIQVATASRQTATGFDLPAGELAMRLRWGFLDLVLQVASEPVLVSAERVCPTPDDHPLEVISVEGQDTLLLRPEYVTTLAARRPD